MQDVRADEEMGLSAGLLQVMLCFLWGLNLVTIRFSNQGIPPMLAAGTRSAVAATVLSLYTRYVKKASGSWEPKDRIHGAAIGFLFGLEFLFLYWGLAYTTASRTVIFLYTNPFWVAIGAHFLLRGDRLTPPKVVGLILAFAGVLAVFGSGSAKLPKDYWIGDLMELGAAVLWAATTLYIKKIDQIRDVTHHQTLFAQLFYSMPVLFGGWVLLEGLKGPRLTPMILAAFGYQCFVVASFSYLLWFWMIRRFAVSGLTSFTFLTPLFGIILGALILSEPVTAMVWVGMVLVGTGIYLVNRPG